MKSFPVKTNKSLKPVWVGYSGFSNWRLLDGALEDDFGQQESELIASVWKLTVTFSENSWKPHDINFFYLGQNDF